MGKTCIKKDRKGEKKNKRCGMEEEKQKDTARDERERERERESE